MIQYIQQYLVQRKHTKLTTKFIWCVFFVCLGLFVFVPQTYAQAVGGNSLDETMRSLVDIIQPILKLIYILMWPILVIAGSALDNTFVYGEFIHLDGALRQMRNISKNFANFALGFFVLKSVLSYFFGFGDGKSTPQATIKNAILAGILIQSSWFLIGAIVDISTVMTYAVGGLPMTLIQQTRLGDQPILGIKTTMDLSAMKTENQNKNDFSYYYTR